MDKGNGKRLFPPRENDQVELQHFASRSFEITDDAPSTLFPRFQESSEHSPLKSLPSSHQGWCSNKNGLRLIVTSMIILCIALTVALIVEIYNNDNTMIKLYSTVVSDNPLCTKAGISILKKGGSAIDASIATILCLCVVHPHNTGIGGGGFMLVHDHKNMKTVSFDFRETAPLNYSYQELKTDVGIPGLLHGLSTAHAQYGKLSWYDVVEPAINIARDGFPVSEYLEEAIISGDYNEIIKSMFYTDSGIIKKNVKSRTLVKTLGIIGRKGIEEFYKGSIGKNIIKDVNRNGGNFQYEDLQNFTTIQTTALKIKWKDFFIESSSFPSYGPSFLKTLKLLENISMNNLNETLVMWEKYIQISSVITDEFSTGSTDLNSWSNIFSDGGNFTSTSISVKHNEMFHMVRHSDRGSSVIAVDNEELFVSLVSGLGSYFGSQIVTADGIIMNDAMKNKIMFTNTLDPNKSIPMIVTRKPYSSLTPVVISDINHKCGLRLATSSASSSLITQFILRKLLLHSSTTDAMSALGVDISFLEKEAYVLTDDPKVNNDVIKALKSQDYHISNSSKPHSYINVISKHDDLMEAYADFKGNDSALEL